MNTQTHSELAGALRRRKIHAEQLGPTLNLSFGEGLRAQRANIDLHDCESQIAHDIESFADGVAMVMREPPRSSAASWDFARTAAHVSPILVPNAFLMGVSSATGGDPAFHVPLSPNVNIAVTVDVGSGVRILPRSQVDRWNATNDRVVAAARSLLFHQTRDARWQKLDGELYRLDTLPDERAVCALVFADVFYSQVGSRLRFGIPSRDEFLFVLDDEPDKVEALKLAVEKKHGDSISPLTTALFGFESGAPTLVEH